MFGYRVPAPDKAMLVSGGRVSSTAPFRVVTGHGAFVLPGFRRANFLTLAMFEAEVNEPCVTRQGIQLLVKAVIAAKVGNDQASIVNAAQRFLSDQGQMPALTGRIFAGHLRSIIGSMTVEEIITQRQTLATTVLDASKEEMARMGLIVDALQIQSIDDGNLGYVRAFAAPHNAAIQQQAQIAQAQAAQNAAKAQQESQRQQAQYQRDTSIAQAGFEAETQAAQQKAAQAGPLAMAQAQQDVIREQTALAQRQAELRQQQLVSEVIKPAQADAQRTQILAEADAKATEVRAAAAASSNRVTLDQALIQQLPSIVEKAAQGLSGSNLTVLNGSEGLTDMVASLVSQGVAVYKSVRENIQEGVDTRGSNGVAPASPQLPERPSVVQPQPPTRR